MDLYTRQFVVRSRQEDLLREARQANLVTVAGDAGKAAAGTSPVGLIVRELRLALSRAGGQKASVASHRHFFHESDREASVTGHIFHSVGA